MRVHEFESLTEDNNNKDGLVSQYALSRAFISKDPSKKMGVGEHEDEYITNVRSRHLSSSAQTTMTRTNASRFDKEGRQKRLTSSICLIKLSASHTMTILGAYQSLKSGITLIFTPLNGCPSTSTFSRSHSGTQWFRGSCAMAGVEEKYRSVSTSCAVSGSRGVCTLRMTWALSTSRTASMTVES